MGCYARDLPIIPILDAADTMTATLDLFADEPDETLPVAAPAPPMTDEQRGTIRGLFAQLGLRTAAEQFALVEELTGVRLTSVTQLRAVQASLLIERLRGRVASAQRITTGNSWADREEDTWIDRL